MTNKFSFLLPVFRVVCVPKKHWATFERIIADRDAYLHISKFDEEALYTGMTLRLIGIMLSFVWVVTIIKFPKVLEIAFPIIVFFVVFIILLKLPKFIVFIAKKISEHKKRST